MDKQGAEFLFQVISNRYECGSVVVTTNRAFQDWGAIVNNDNTLASAMIDRLVHHGVKEENEGPPARAISFFDTEATEDGLEEEKTKVFSAALAYLAFAIFV